MREGQPKGHFDSILGFVRGSGERVLSHSQLTHTRLQLLPSSAPVTLASSLTLELPSA